jgi:hypothetical protein
MTFKLMMALVYSWLVLNVVGFSIYAIATIKTDYVLAAMLGCVALIQFVCLVGCIRAYLRPRKKK